MALMGANPRTIYIVTSAVGGALAGVAAALLIIQYSVHPFFGAAFGPLTFMICVLGGLGKHGRAFVAFVHHERGHLDRRRDVGRPRWGTGSPSCFFIVMIFARPGGILGKRA